MIHDQGREGEEEKDREGRGLGGREEGRSWEGEEKKEGERKEDFRPKLTKNQKQESRWVMFFCSSSQAWRAECKFNVPWQFGLVLV